MNERKVAIIGAGFGGMTAAWDLARAGCQVTVYESADYAGGIASGFKEPHWDWSVEKFYHHWFASDDHMLRLLDELGVRDKVLFPRPYTVMYYNGKFYPFDSILHAVLYPGLGFGINKVRFGMVGLYLRMTNNWRPLEKYTVDAWMRKWAGRKVYEEMWEPMVIGKFGERYAKQVSMAWMWARLKARTTRLGTYEGGFQAFADLFAERLRGMGVDIRLNTPVTGFKPLAAGGWEVTSAGQMETFDQVLSTTSPGLLAKMAPDLPATYLDGLLSLKSMGAMVMVVSLKQQLSREGYYWFNLPKSTGFPFLALVEHTNFVSPQHFGGEHIIYMGDYLETEHEHFQMSQEQLLAKFLPSLQRINPAFSPEWVNNAWLFRTAYAQPVPLVNHSRNIPDVRTPLPGLYFASMSQVYPWDRGTNYAVEIARRAAGMMLADQSDRHG
ncbi:MAG: NAD(P)/FAD-dependent oxidoreductase [Anaerolineae bacterium]|nr:NAD(P)/FAD-dependent oxidoreductase [Anaerolineae bacterium]